MSDTSQSIVAFNQEQVARLLVTYLRAQRMQVDYKYQSGDMPHTIVLSDMAQLDEAKAYIEEFLANPHHEKYQKLAWQQGSTVELSEGGGVFGSARFPKLTETPFTSLILVSCIAAYIAAFFVGTGLLQMHPLAEIMETGQVWRLIGPVFIHYDEAHIIFNLLWWWMLGGQIEKRFGISTLLMVFATTALVSNIGQLLVSGPNFGGLSGVVYGVVGFVWALGWLRPNWGVSLPNSMFGFLIVWLLLGYADILWVSMANTAHTLGLVSGCALAGLFAQLVPQNNSKS